MKWRFALGVAALLAACSSVRPAPVQVGDRCFRCRVAIGEPKLAAEIVTPEGTPFPFRTSGCLAKYLKSHPTDPGTMFVTDYKSGRLFRASEAWFVPTTLVQGKVQEKDYLAFRARGDADAANTERAELLRWDAVVASAPTH